MILDQQQQQRQTLSMRVWWLLRESDFQAAEAIVWLGMLDWSLLLLFAPNLFSVSAVYAVMRTFGQPFWSVIAATVFLVHSLGAGLGWRHLRLLGLFLIFLWFLAMGTMFAKSGVYNVASGLHFGLSFGAGWAFLRSIARQPTGND